MTRRPRPRPRAPTSRSTSTPSSSAPAPAARSRCASSRAPGLKVVALEEGGYHRPPTSISARTTCCRCSSRTAAGAPPTTSAIRVLSGRGVGGSTVHNTNLCKRTPDAILDLWARKYGVEGAARRTWSRRSRASRRISSVSRDPRARTSTANNDALRRGAAALGWKGGVAPPQPRRLPEERLLRARLRLRREAERAQGRRPAGARRRRELYSDVDVRRDPRRARRGRRRRGDRRTTACGRRSGAVARVRVRAKVVVLAGSAVGSAALARRSGLPDPHARLGRGLRMHPGGVVAGRFDDADPRATAASRSRTSARSSSPSRRGATGACGLSPRSRTRLAPPRRCPASAPRTCARCAPTDTSPCSRRWSTTRRAGEVDVDGDGEPSSLPDDRARSRAAREGPRRVRAHPPRGRRA